MKRCWNHKAAGWILAAAGVIIILSLILPACVWWFILGAILIALGIIIISR